MLTKFLRLWTCLCVVSSCLGRRADPGPTVDPGVFVITHIQSCRGGAGYCILGYSCDVDKDFVPDDLGGNCDGLGAAFNPVTSFVCCRENPENFVGKEKGGEEVEDHIVEAQISTTTEATTTTTTTTTTVSTSIVTEIVTEIVTVTEKDVEIITKVEPVVEIITETTIEPIEHGARISDIQSETEMTHLEINSDTENENKTAFSSDEPEKNCFAAILMGMQCGGNDQQDDQIIKTQTGLEPDRDDFGPKPMTVTSGDDASLSLNTAAPLLLISEANLGDIIDDDIVPLKFKTENPPEKGAPVKLYRLDDSENERFRTEELATLNQISLDGQYGSGLEQFVPHPAVTTPQTVKTDPDPEPINLNIDMFDQSEEEMLPKRPRLEVSDEDFFHGQCGSLGGAAILQAFGRAAPNILPDLVARWVTGDVGGGLMKKSRLDDDELEPRIIGGDVTSTVLYCWMAAIVEFNPSDKKKFVCTGALVQPDLIITSASCTYRIFERGTQHFRVVLGDSNLNIDLPFGVQTHEISQVVVHENYKPEESFHFDDIGLIKLKTLAKMENTVCKLCLPAQDQPSEEKNCTVVGYGRPVDGTNINLAFDDESNSDGILRKAELPLVDSNVCLDYLRSNSASFPHGSLGDGFLCAGGHGEEESCYVAMDGGSPLSCQRDGKYELTGLVTFATSCPEDKTPSLFTNVAKYSNWIRRNYLKMK